VSIFRERTGVATRKATFSTVFIRNEGFRFNFRVVQGYGGEQRYRIRSRRGVTMVSKGSDAWEDKGALFHAIAALTGVTSGTSLHVASMLLPGSNVFSVADALKCAHQMELRVIDGIDCYVFVCVNESRGLRSLVALQKSDLLLRRYERVKYFGEVPRATTLAEAGLHGRPLAGWVSSEEIVAYRPEMNVRMDPEGIASDSERGW
jgi:hypothetical protein